MTGLTQPIFIIIITIIITITTIIINSFVAWLITMPTIDELYKYIDVREGLDSDGVGVSVCALYMPPKDIEGNDTMPLNLAYLREHETTAEEASRRSRQNRTAKMEEATWDLDTPHTKGT